MLRKVAFTMYPVTDMARARNFYESTMGLTRGNGSGESPWVEYDLPGGGCFAITTVTGGTPATNAGGMIAFEVDDIDATIADLETKEVSFKSDMIHSPVCRMRVIEDSEGNAILLHELNNKRD